MTPMLDQIVETKQIAFPSLNFVQVKAKEKKDTKSLEQITTEQLIWRLGKMTPNV